MKSIVEGTLDLYSCGGRNVKVLPHTFQKPAGLLGYSGRTGSSHCSLCLPLFTHENSVDMVAHSDGGRRCSGSCCVSACPGSVPRTLKLKCCSFCSSDRPQCLCSPASCPPAAPQQPDLLTLWGLPTLQKPHVRPQEEGRGKCTSALNSFFG